MHRAIAGMSKDQRPYALLRATLITSAAISALAAGLNGTWAQVPLDPPGQIPPQCMGVGGVFTCTGDLSVGLQANGPTLTDLTVENLTSIIMPGSGDDGIDFTTTDGNNINLIVDTGTLGTSNFGIVTEGFRADGILAFNPGDGNITINSIGNIDARAADQGKGINVQLQGSGDVIVTSTGDILAEDDAIAVPASGADTSVNVTIESVGNLTSSGASSNGVDVSIRNGNASIHSQGNIVAEGFGIDVISQNGDVSIVSVGHITTNKFQGIDASARNGDITIQSTGTITAGDQGIRADHGGSGQISIEVTGNVQAEADNRAGILADMETDTADATVTINAGSMITGGGGTGSGVRFEGGRTNRLDNWGTIQSDSGSAVEGVENFFGVSGQDHVVNYATLNGTVDLGANDDSLTLTPTSVINGVASGGADTDALRFNGTGTGTFGLSTIDTGGNTQQYRDFESFEVTGGLWLFSETTTVSFSVGSGMLGDTTTFGTLGGNATFGGLVINDGGTLAPGNSIGTINSTGNVAFNDGSTFAVDINPNGTSDLLDVTGAVTISGTGTTLNAVLDPFILPTDITTWTLIEAGGGVTGQFATVTDNLPDIDLLAVYNANTVQLTFVPSGDDVSPKQVYPSASAAAMDSALLFSDALRRRGGLQVSGQLDNPSAGESFGFLPTATSVAAMGSGKLSEASRDWSIWGSVLGSDTDVDADGATPGWNATDAGLAFGLERQGQTGSGTSFTAGLAGGYISTDVDSNSSSAQIDSWLVGAYAATKKGRLTLSGSASYAHHDFDYSRLITLGSGTVLANGQADGESLAGSAEAFFDLSQIAGNGTRFGPLATLDAAYVHRDAFTETGAGLLNQSVGSDNATQAVTGLGAAISVNRDMGGTSMTIDARIAWQHVFGDRSIATASAIPIVNASFLTPSALIDRNRLAIGLGAAARFTDTISGHIRYDGVFGQNSTSHDGTAGFTVSF